MTRPAPTLALHGVPILTPGGFVHDHALVLAGGRIATIAPAAALLADAPPEMAIRDLRDAGAGAALLPGFIDTQVNGGGGVLLNDSPTVDGVAAIAAAHRRFGTTGLLPTLISDDLDVLARAIRAVDDAIAAGVPGVLGIHLEGPFLNPARKGIHDAAKFRTLDAAAIDLLSGLRRGRTLVTLAPELAPPGAIADLVARGVIVSAGHTAADHATIRRALDEGMTGFTHLFNAMTPFGSREPGVVGAALEDGGSWCGLIVDGHHVHPASLRVAARAKGLERLMLVTDAMPTVGRDEKSFTLGGRTIRAADGRCVAEDGTLAGSDLDMMTAVRNTMAVLDLPLERAVPLASANPARFLGLDGERGELLPGRAADMVLIDGGRRVREVWIGGRSFPAA